MTSLKEALRQMPWGDLESEHGIEDWAEGYIKQLEEQMKRFREASPDPEDHVGEGAYYFPLIMNEVLRFLRGETK
jgi:hypothetical protein